MVALARAAVFWLAIAQVCPPGLAGDIAASRDRQRALFDKERALAFLRAQCAFGPRVPGTPPHSRARDYLKRELARWADEVQEQRFSEVLGAGRVELTNLIAIFHPSGSEKALAGKEAAAPESSTRVLVCAHWDSRPTADQETDPQRRARPIPGANDGASDTAVVLELSRVLAVRRPPQEVMLVLFDGEDYGPKIDRMLLGSRHFARNYRGPKPEWAALLDMVGDKNLEIPVEGYSQQMAPKVVERIWQAAEAIGSRPFVRRPGPWVQDDHLPLLRAGIPCIALIDFDYPYWHTLEDTPDKCSADSLQAVGDVLLHAIYNTRVAPQADEPAAPSPQGRNRGPAKATSHADPPAGGWPGGSAIAGHWGRTRMRGREHHKCVLIRAPICGMIAEAQQTPATRAQDSTVRRGLPPSMV
jgi:hypothetical protein